MPIPDPAGYVLLAATLGLLAQTVRLGRRWRRGRPAAVAWRAGLARLPRAYLHTVHGVVARDPFASRMHMLAAGGLVAALLLSVLRHVLGIGVLGIGGTLIFGMIVVAVLAACAGVAMAAWRRRPPRPARLTGGRYDALPVALAGSVLFLLLAALQTPNSGPADWAGVVSLGAVSLGVLVWWTVSGPLRHVPAGLVSLAAHPRPSRFADRISADLMPLRVPSPGQPVPQIGVGMVTDFAWNRLAQFDACVQCGRCQVACPAFAAGQALNPKAVIQDLVRAATAAADGAMRDLVASDRRDGAIQREALWACTTCRACVHECPMLIEHVDAIVDMRRFETLERGAVPDGAAAVLAELRATDTVAGRALDTRLDWATDLALPVMADRGRADVLLWLGDGAFDRRTQKTLRALVRLLRHADVEFAVLGAEELDCGDLARRLGDEVTFQDLAARTIATLARYQFATILTADPHALHTLRNEYPALGGHYRVVHHAAFLEQLLADGRLHVASAAAAAPVTYHDPCYLGRYNGEIAAPRRLLARLGLSVREMERAGMRSLCCGGGGGAPLADSPGRRRIPDIRMDQARATAAPTLAVACPNCMQMFEGVTGEHPVVVDLAELVWQAVEAAALPAPARAA